MTDLEMFLVKSQWLIIQQNNHLIRQNVNLGSAVNSVMTALSHIATGNGAGIADAIEVHIQNMEANTRSDMESWTELSSEILRLARFVDSLERRG